MRDDGRLPVTAAGRQPRARRDGGRARESRGALRRAARAGDSARLVRRDCGPRARSPRLGQEAAGGGRMDADRTSSTASACPTRGAIESSVAEPVDDRRPLRAAGIDRRRRVSRQTRTELRITDHKTGRNRTTPRTVIGGGATLQPVIYGLAVEKLLGRPVDRWTPVLLHRGGRIHRASSAALRGESPRRARSTRDHRPRHRARLPSSRARRSGPARGATSARSAGRTSRCTCAASRPTRSAT